MLGLTEEFPSEVDKDKFMMLIGVAVTAHAREIWRNKDSNSITDGSV
jgi:hypothetical protein